MKYEFIAEKLAQAPSISNLFVIAAVKINTLLFFQYHTCYLNKLDLHYILYEHFCSRIIIITIVKSNIFTNFSIVLGLEPFSKMVLRAHAFSSISCCHRSFGRPLHLLPSDNHLSTDLGSFSPSVVSQSLI